MNSLSLFECQEEVKKKNQEQQQETKETKSNENLLLNTKKIAKRKPNQNYGFD